MNSQTTAEQALGICLVLRSRPQIALAPLIVPVMRWFLPSRRTVANEPRATVTGSQKTIGRVGSICVLDRVSDCVSPEGNTTIESASSTDPVDRGPKERHLFARCPEIDRVRKPLEDPTPNFATHALKGQGG